MKTKIDGMQEHVSCKNICGSCVHVDYPFKDPVEVMFGDQQKKLAERMYFLQNLNQVPEGIFLRCIQLTIG